MGWAAAARRADPSTVEGRVFAGLDQMGRERAAQIALRAGAPAELRDAGDDRVLAYLRQHPRGSRLVALAAFSDEPVRLPRDAALLQLAAGARLALASPGVELTGQDLLLPAWSYAWVVED
jgi:amylosucrase